MRKINFLYYILILALFYNCIDPYNPPEITADRSYLVIDGNYLAGEVSQVKLSLTQNLNEDTETSLIAGALVELEDKNKKSFKYDESLPGIYQLPATDIPLNTLVRLKIVWQGQQYLSQYVPVVPSPEIDSVNYTVEDDGIQFYVTTHDPDNNTKYYRWRYSETWELTSAFSSNFVYDNGEIKNRTDNIYTCWNYEDSKEIYVSTSDNLAQDVIYLFPLHKVSANSQSLRIKYSVLVEQYALTREAYNYYKELKNNTENLGTLFDPLPFQLNGNFTNTSNPEEPVIGYFYAVNPTRKRIFVTPNDHDFFIRNNLTTTCELDTVLTANVPQEAVSKLIVSEYYSEFGPDVLGYLMASPRCVDCRYRGTNIEPEFWQ
jgi:hypothetical protein